MKVKTVQRFFDRKLRVIHEDGDEFETSKDRAEKLKNMGFIKEIKMKHTKKEGEAE